MYIRAESFDDVPVGQPKIVPHHDDAPLTPPILWSLVSLLGICIIFILYRRARRLIPVGFQLRNVIRSAEEGRIRLSEDGPPALSFTHDDFEGDEGEDERRR